MPRPRLVVLIGRPLGRLVVVTVLGIDPGQALFLSEEDLTAQNEAKPRLYDEIATSLPRRLTFPPAR